jgi:hypothetical protein
MTFKHSQKLPLSNLSPYIKVSIFLGILLAPAIVFRILYMLSGCSGARECSRYEKARRERRCNRQGCVSECVPPGRLYTGEPEAPVRKKSV